MGALTVAVEKRGGIGDLRYLWANVTFSTSYATGGDTGLTPAALGWDRVLLTLFDQPAGLKLAYNYTNGQVLAYRVGAYTHASTAVDAHAGSAVTAHGTHQHNVTTVAAAGGGTAMLTPMVAGALEGGAQTNTNAVDAGGPTTHTVTQPSAHAVTQPAAHAQVDLAEVTATTDLSAVTSAGNLNFNGAASTSVRVLCVGY